MLHPMRDNRESIDAWITAQSARDWGAVRALYAPDVVVDRPQTGERIIGLDHVIRLDQEYPGEVPRVDVHRAVGSEGRWVLDPSFVPRRILGSGDVWICEATMTYPAGDQWEYAAVVEIREGRIVRQTEYRAPRSDPPAWRTHLVEHIR
jgi:ketosteroid isomerase-like protein